MECNHEVETQVVNLTAYLRHELGYQTDAPGSLRRQLEENTAMIRAIDQTLRGQGDELGLVGWMMVLRRTWIAMVALLGMALGYALNDVVDALGLNRASVRFTSGMEGGAMKDT
jgi:hypothetical protein